MPVTEYVPSKNMIVPPVPASVSAELSDEYAYAFASEVPSAEPCAVGAIYTVAMIFY